MLWLILQQQATLHFRFLQCLRVAVIDCCIAEVNVSYKRASGLNIFMHACVGHAEIDQTLRNYACSAKLSAYSLSFLSILLLQQY